MKRPAQLEFQNYFSKTLDKWLQLWYNKYIKGKEMITMTENRQKLLDRMIRIYGYEHEITIKYAEMLEKFPPEEIYENTLRILVESHEEFPQLDD
jgi:hypothetical protein